MGVLITGGGGQLATDLVSTFADREVMALTHRGLDIQLTEDVEAALTAHRPDVVLNTAAYHHVDRCETEPEKSFLVNAAAPQRLAAVCEQYGILLIHFSTDYVFDGRKSTPYLESDMLCPLSVYGASKAAGEMAIRATTDRHIIIRTTGLYGTGGLSTGRGNFVETMLRAASAGQPVTVVADQVMTPTASIDLAVATRKLMEVGARGTFHVTNSGWCSWFGFAAAIFRQEGLAVDLRPTTQQKRPLPARRPAYSVMAHAALLDSGLDDLRDWHEALHDYLRQRRRVLETGNTRQRSSPQSE